MFVCSISFFSLYYSSTHVAGTTCGDTYGVSTNCKLCAVKVLDDSGSGSWSGVIAGINHVANKCSTTSGMKCVANMSLGGGKNDALNTAVADAVSAGVVMVVAAGNSNAVACKYSPASASTAITVGSTTSADVRSGFSNYGTCVDVYAPGSSILSTWIGSNTATNTISGTSMASPRKFLCSRMNPILPMCIIATFAIVSLLSVT